MRRTLPPVEPAIVPNETAPSTEPQLLRALGPVQGTMIVIGTVIGSGIFLKPAIIATQVPHFGGIMLVWIVSGLLSLAGALAYAELGAMMPRAGGPYVFLRAAFGQRAAFLFGWTEFLINRPGSLAALAMASVQYLSVLHPFTPLQQSGLAIAEILLLTAINYAGVQFGAQVQTVFTVAKVAALGGLIGGALVMGQGSSANFTPLLPESFDGASLSLFGGAMIGALWAYDGWANATSVAEELRDPQRNVPLCLIAGTVIIIGIYLSANVAYHYVLPLDVVQHSQSSVPGGREVAAETAFRLFGAAGLTFIAVGVMCSTFGAANGVALTGSRITFAMSRDRAFFRSIAAVHPRFRTPHVSIVVQAMLAIALIGFADRLYPVLRPVVASLQESALAANAVTGPFIGWLGKTVAEKKLVFDVLTDCIIVVSWVFYALAVASVFVLRRKQPDTPRPYRCWGYPVVPALFVAMATWFVANAFKASPVEAVLGLGLAALGLPAYAWFRKTGGGAEGDRTPDL